jgi:hypothetical protein
MSRIGKIIDFTGVFSWKWAWISGICYTSLGIVYIILKGLNNPMVHGPPVHDRYSFPARLDFKEGD